MGIFRDAVASLAPHVEKAKIEWRDASAYDDWDAIAEVLFEKLVIASIKWSVLEADRDRLDFPKYNTLYDSYEQKAIITVERENNPLVFHSLSMVDAPFDSVRAVELGRPHRTAEDFVLIPFSLVTFAVRSHLGTMKTLNVDV